MYKSCVELVLGRGSASASTFMSTPPSATDVMADVMADVVPGEANIMGEPVEHHETLMEHALDTLEVETHLDAFPALVLFFGSATALGLTVYFFLQLSDLTDDLINPYTLCDKVNSKLKYEFAAHALCVFAFVLAWQPQLVVLCLPALALRALWHRSRKLEIDATTCYNSKVQSSLRTRWGVMAAWHGFAVLFGFIQVLLHGILGLHRTMPHTMHAMGKAHMMQAGLYGGPGGHPHLHPMGAMGIAAMHHL